MTELIEGVAIAPPEQAEETEEEKEKKPKKIRIALFFDGTLNNRLNIEAREKVSEAYTKKTGFLGFFARDPNSNSYDNGRTNINIMQQAIGENFKPESIDYFATHYIEGQGSFNLKEDSTLGYAAGAGGSGVRSRANLGVDHAYNSISELEGFDKKQHYIEELTFDVFGFSRGAATARYAIFLLLKSKNNMFKRLKNAKYDIKEEAITVGFAGLYDTVLSYLGSQRMKLEIDFCEQKSHIHAKKVLHLASAEEHRKDFPLSDISGSTAKGTGKEYFLPGVHSDVGGSYNMADEEKIRAESDPEKQRKLMMVPRSETKLTIYEGDLVEIEHDKANLIKQGWFKGTPCNMATIEQQAKQTIETAAKQRKREVVLPIDGEFTITLMFSRPREHGKRGLASRRASQSPYRFRGAALTITRKNINTGYSNIPLKIMAKHAKEDAKLSFMPKMLKRADTVIDIVDLGTLEGKINAYIGSKAKGSAAKDWLEGSHNEDIIPYRHDHLNFSAKCELGYAPDIVEGKRLRYVFDA